MIDRRRRARVASHLVALFAIVASIFAGTVGPIPVSAQPAAPELSIEGDPIGPVSVEPLSNLAVHITNLTPSSTFTLNVYTGTTCTGTVDSSPAPANDDGEYFGSVPIGSSPAISIQAIDQGGGTSNCVAATAEVPQAPVLSINGDTVGPVTFVSGSIMTVRVTGLTSGTNFMFNVYQSVDCSGTPGGLSTPVGLSGEYAPPGVPFTGAQIVSFRMVDVNNGESNCVGIIVTEAAPPVLSINGDEVGPVEVPLFTDFDVDVTGLSADAVVTLNLYTGSMCTTGAVVSEGMSNASGEFSGSLPLGGVPVLSVEVVDTINGTSNCVTINGTHPAPSLTVNGDSVGPVTFVQGTTVVFLMTDLPPNSSFTLNTYTGAGCTGFPGGSLRNADATGEYTESLLGGVWDSSFQVVNEFGSSNCIDVSSLPIPPPVLSIDGDEVGPVNILTGMSVDIQVTGMLPGIDFNLYQYLGPECTGTPAATTLGRSDVNGEFTQTASFFAALVISHQTSDLVHGVSNCVTVNVTDREPPVLSIDGDTVGPVELVAPASAEIYIAGLTPNSTFTLNVYNGTDCVSFATGGPNAADANGEFTGPAPFGGSQTISYQAVDDVTGTSNCVGVIVSAPPPPVLAIESDTIGPVELVSGETADFHITGLTPNTNFTLNAYNGTDCTVYADGGPNLADASGEFNSSAPYGGPQTVSYMAIDTVAGASNCVTVIVSDPVVPPVLSFNGDSVGPVQVTVGGFVVLRITGLTPSTQFLLKAYSDTNCSVTALEYLFIANGEGEHEDDWPANSATSYSYQATDYAKGTSNCVAVIVSDAPTPTETPSPTAVPTETPAPTVEPTTTPEPTVAPDPIPDSTVNVTGDPRFPISGQVSIPGFTGLTFTLNTQPSNGTVTIQPDGTFTYSASSYLATFDRFTVLATAGNGETAIVTVNVTLVIDKSVPTYGEVGSGGTGYGGDVNDPRSSTRPNPTAVPEDDEDGSGVEPR